MSKRSRTYFRNDRRLPGELSWLAYETIPLRGIAPSMRRQRRRAGICGWDSNLWRFDRLAQSFACDRQRGEAQESGYGFMKQRRASWAAFIKKVYEVEPLRCPECGGEIPQSGISFIDTCQGEGVEKILQHYGQWQDAASCPDYDEGYFERLCIERAPDNIISYLDGCFFMLLWAALLPEYI